MQVLANTHIKGRFAQPTLQPQHIHSDGIVVQCLHPARKEIGFSHKAGCEQGSRPFIHFPRCSQMLDNSVLEHHYPVGHGQSFFLVMGDKHKGDAQLPLQAFQFNLHGTPELVVQCRQGFIQQQQPGTLDHRPGNGHPLLLATGQLMGFAPGKVLQLHHGQGFLHPLPDLVLWPLFHFQAIGHIVEHRHMGKQGIVLEHGIEGTVFRRAQGQVLTGQGDGAGIRKLKPCHQAQQGGLATTRRPKKGNKFTVKDLQIQGVQNGFAVKLLGNAGQRKQCLHYRPCPWKDRLFFQNPGQTKRG